MSKAKRRYPRNRSELFVIRLAPGVRVRNGELVYALPDGTVTNVPGNTWVGIARGTVRGSVAVEVSRLPIPDK
jgi:hypothetical protein